MARRVQRLTPVKLRLIRAAALVLCGLAALYATTPIAADVGLQDELNAAETCPPMPARIAPLEIHLEPSIAQHQSWVLFVVPRRFDGSFAFCLDGRVLSSGDGQLDFHTGAARFNIATRIVNLAWFARTLDRLADGSHWELRLQCALNYGCG
jgi:hypothetical protein